MRQTGAVRALRALVIVLVFPYNDYIRKRFELEKNASFPDTMSQEKVLDELGS